jgi:hypothetical protein
MTGSAFAMIGSTSLEVSLMRLSVQMLTHTVFHIAELTRVCKDIERVALHIFEDQRLQALFACT